MHRAPGVRRRAWVRGGQRFLLEWCDFFRLPRPDPPLGKNERNTCTFGRLVTRVRPNGTVSPNWIDLYKASHLGT